MGLRTKVLLPLMVLSLLLLSYLYGYWMPSSLANIEDRHRVSVERHIESVAEALVPLLLARQLDTVYENLDALSRRNTDWVSVRLFDDQGRMIYPLKALPPAVRGGSAPDIHTIERRIDYLDAHMGKLVVEVDFAPRLSAMERRHIELLSMLLLIIAGYIVTTGFVLDRAARRPINILAQASRKLAEGDFSAILPQKGNDEVGTLVSSFQSMRDTIRNYQTELKEASSYNRSLIEASLDPLVTIDSSGKITDVNAATEKVTGHTRAELIGTDFSTYFTEPDKARAGYQQVFRENTVYDYPLEIKSGDGRVTSVLYNASVFRNEQGEVAGVFATARDITERKRIEVRLGEQREFLQKTIESLTHPFYVIDAANYTIIMANAAARLDVLSGASTCYALTHWRDRPCSGDDHICPLEVVKRTKHPVTVEHTHYDKDGTKRIVEVHGYPILDSNGNVIQMIEYSLDISERKKAEKEILQLNAELEQRVTRRTIELQNKSHELEEANNRLKELDQLKSMFIASMSHELRTPLNSIIGFSSITLEEWTGPLNEEQKKNLTAVLRSGRHLLALINDIIDISKIEAGKHEVTIEDFDLQALVFDAVSLFRKEIDEKGLELKTELLHLDMRTDRRRLLQCMVNLVGNAVKFTERGRITVGAGLVPALKEDGQPQGLPLQDFVQISVTDTGIGIKKEDQPKLFSAFTRIPSPLSMKVRGTGLGLYLVRKIATEILMGEVTVQSELGEGSSFCLRIPIKL